MKGKEKKRELVLHLLVNSPNGYIGHGWFSPKLGAWISIWGLCKAGKADTEREIKGANEQMK